MLARCSTKNPLFGIDINRDRLVVMELRERTIKYECESRY
jgi:hypothetical protein